MFRGDNDNSLCGLPAFRWSHPRTRKCVCCCRVQEARVPVIFLARVLCVGERSPRWPGGELVISVLRSANRYVISRRWPGGELVISVLRPANRFLISRRWPGGELVISVLRSANRYVISGQWPGGECFTPSQLVWLSHGGGLAVSKLVISVLRPANRYGYLTAVAWR